MVYLRKSRNCGKPDLLQFSHSCPAALASKRKQKEIHPKKRVQNLRLQDGALEAQILGQLPAKIWANEMGTRAHHASAGQSPACYLK